METKRNRRKEREIKVYKTPEEALEAKHEKARKFIKKIDLSQIAVLHPTKNP